MGVVGLTALGSLVLASRGMYVAFSYVAAAFILSVVATAVVEHGESESATAPYTGILGWLAVIFVAGLTAIWLLWSPGVDDYQYVLGVPASTLVYIVVIWLLPLVAALYYSVTFDRIAGEEVVDDILTAARERQRRNDYPLAPDRPDEGTDAEIRDD